MDDHLVKLNVGMALYTTEGTKYDQLEFNVKTGDGWTIQAICQTDSSRQNAAREEAMHKATLPPGLLIISHTPSAKGR